MKDTSDRQLASDLAGLQGWLSRPEMETPDWVIEAVMEARRRLGPADVKVYDLRAFTEPKA